MFSPDPGVRDTMSMETPAGFTLIETLVALAILAVGLLATLKVMHVTLESLQQARIRSLALLCADNELVRYRSLRVTQPTVEVMRPCVQDRYQFRVEVRDEPTLHARFRLLDVRVFREGDSTLMLAQRFAYLPQGF
jgi:general secretion pathway protein I